MSAFDRTKLRQSLTGAEEKHKVFENGIVSYMGGLQKNEKKENSHLNGCSDFVALSFRMQNRLSLLFQASSQFSFREEL